MNVENPRCQLFAKADTVDSRLRISIFIAIVTAMVVLFLRWERYDCRRNIKGIPG